MISLSFVFVSIVGMVISTLPALQYQARDGSMVENPWLSLIETISIAWFTLEYFLRWELGRTVRAVLTLNCFQVRWSSSQVSVSH